MPVLILHTIVLMFCLSAISAQVVPGLMPKDTVHTTTIHVSDSTKTDHDTTETRGKISTADNKVFDIQNVLDFEIAGGIGWGEYGYTYPFFIRYKHFGISMVVPIHYTHIRSTIDEPPSGNDYTLEKFISSPLIFSAEYYFLLRENFYVFPSIGFSRKQEEVLPKDNVLPIYYRAASQREIFSFCFGVGVEYYVRLEKRVGIGLQLAHRNIIGTTCTLGICFRLSPRHYD